MADLPIMPLKTDALLSDTTHMSPEEFGVYCRLLFVMWRQEARLPNDDAELAIIGGVTLARWRKIKEKVMRPMTIAGDQVSQKRLTATWMEVQELRRKRTGAANKKWESKRQAEQMHVHLQSLLQTPMQNDAIQNQRSKITTTSVVEGPKGLGSVEQAEKPALIASPELVASLSKRSH